MAAAAGLFGGGGGGHVLVPPSPQARRPRVVRRENTNNLFESIGLAPQLFVEFVPRVVELSAQRSGVVRARLCRLVETARSRATVGDLLPFGDPAPCSRAPRIV